MKVSEADARRFLEEIGKAKPDTPSKRVLARLNNIEDTIEDLDDKCELSDFSSSFLTKVCDAVQNEGVIEFDDSSEAPPKSAPSAEGKPTKEPPVEKLSSSKKKQPKEAENKPKWTPSDVKKELHKLQEEFGDDTKAMVKSVKEQIKKTKDKDVKYLCEMVLEELGLEDVEAPPKVVKSEASEEESEEPKKKAPGKQGAKDSFGNLMNSQGHQVNVCLSKEPKKLDEIVSECGLSKSRVRGHLNWLRDEKGLVEESEEGWRVK